MDGGGCGWLKFSGANEGAISPVSVVSMCVRLRVQTGEPETRAAGGRPENCGNKTVCVRTHFTARRPNRHIIRVWVLPIRVSLKPLAAECPPIVRFGSNRTKPLLTGNVLFMQ